MGDGLNGNDQGEKEGARKKRRGPQSFTAVNAPPGHVKMFFVASPDRVDRVICLLCQAKHADEPVRYVVA